MQHDDRGHLDHHGDANPRSSSWLVTYPAYKRFQTYVPDERPVVEHGWSFTHRLPSMYHHMFHPQKISHPPLVVPEQPCSSDS